MLYVDRWMLSKMQEVTTLQMKPTPTTYGWCTKRAYRVLNILHYMQISSSSCTTWQKIQVTTFGTPLGTRTFCDNFFHFSLYIKILSSLLTYTRTTFYSYYEVDKMFLVVFLIWVGAQKYDHWLMADMLNLYLILIYCRFTLEGEEWADLRISSLGHALHVFVNGIYIGKMLSRGQITFTFARSSICNIFEKGYMYNLLAAWT